jgi:hypothetical protein
MIILGIILLVLGYFVSRPLLYVGAVLLVIGLILWMASASPYPAYY